MNSIRTVSADSYREPHNVAPNNGRTNWPPTDFKPLFCSGDALAANGVSLALDAVGFFLPAKGAAGAVAMTVSGVASAFNSLYHQDGVGAGAGAAGEAVGLTYGGALAIGASWAGVLPGVSTVAGGPLKSRSDLRRAG